SDGPDAKTPIAIVGVVKTFAYRGIRVTDDQAFFPFLEGLPGSGAFYVRTRTESQAAVSSIRSVVRQIDSNLPVLDFRTLDDQLDRSLLNERMLATLARAFAALAVLLTAVGHYGVIALVR